MTPIDSLLAAKKAIAASEAAELAKDYYEARTQAAYARLHLVDWDKAIYAEESGQRRDKGIADTTEIMAEAYRHEHRQ